MPSVATEAPSHRERKGISNGLPSGSRDVATIATIKLDAPSAPVRLCNSYNSTEFNVIHGMVEIISVSIILIILIIIK